MYYFYSNINLYRIQQERGISNHSLEHRRTIINTFFNWCVAEGYLERNPCITIKPIKYQEKPREPLTHVEMEYLRDACKTNRERAIIEIFYSTGCRVSELCALDKSDINLETKEVTLFGKGGKTRTSYLSARAQVHLQKYLEEREDDNDALFVSSRNPHSRMKKCGIEKIVKQICERSCVRHNVFPHLIRHTIATDCLSSGMKVTELQKLLGHVNINTTMVYAKVLTADVKNSHEKFVV